MTTYPIGTPVIVLWDVHDPTRTLLATAGTIGTVVAIESDPLSIALPHLIQCRGTRVVLYDHEITQNRSIQFLTEKDVL